MNEMDSSDTYRSLDNLLYSKATKYDIAYFNFNKNIQNKETLFVDKVHLNDLGYNFFAERILQCLKK